MDKSAINEGSIIKTIRLLLVGCLTFSGLFQFLIGIWILADLKSAGSMLLGIVSDPNLQKMSEFALLSKIAGKAFLMLAGYSLVTAVCICRGLEGGLIMAVSTGLMISIIAVTTYLDTGSMIVWLTDFTRGGIILILSLIYLKMEGRRKHSHGC